MLVLVNVLVFLWELTLPEKRLEQAFFQYGIVPRRLGEGGGYFTFLTHQFLHAGWLHVIGNLWTLWIFGDNVEDRMGHGRFLGFYLLCGVLAGLAQSLASAGSGLPSIGASGAIAGVMGAYFVLFPRARVITFVPVFFYPLFFEIPAVVYLGLWFAMQLFSGTLSLASPSDVGGIAFLAHVGGFVAGLLLHRLFVRARHPGRVRPV